MPTRAKKGKGGRSPSKSKSASRSRSPARSPRWRGKSDTNEMAGMLKLVPQLNEVGYDIWLKAIQLVAYSEDWYDTEAGLFETEEGWQPSDFDMSLSEKSDKRARKLCFTLMYKTCKDLEYFFEGIKLGDVIAASNQIARIYNRQTTAGFIASQKAFTGSSMAQDHVDVSIYCSNCRPRKTREIARRHDNQKGENLRASRGAATGV